MYGSKLQKEHAGGGGWTRPKVYTYIYNLQNNEILVFHHVGLCKVDFEIDPAGPVWLRFTFSDDYPSVPPVIEVPMNSQVLSPAQCQALLSHLQEQVMLWN